jgi:hypothetical protein
MRVSTVSEMSALDRTAIEEFGITEELLMENAGQSVYFVILTESSIAGKHFLTFSAWATTAVTASSWRGRSTPAADTLYSLRRCDAEVFIEIADQLDLDVGTSVFPFEALQDALILAKQGRLGQPNAVIKIAD